MADDKRVVSLLHPAPNKLAGDVEEFRRKLPTVIEHTKLMAKLQREAYLAYLEEGFTAKQALDLVKAMR